MHDLVRDHDEDRLVAIAIELRGDQAERVVRLDLVGHRVARRVGLRMCRHGDEKRRDCEDDPDHGVPPPGTILPARGFTLSLTKSTLTTGAPSGLPPATSIDFSTGSYHSCVNRIVCVPSGTSIGLV